MERLLRVLVDEVCGEVGADAARGLLVLRDCTPKEAPRGREEDPLLARVYTPVAPIARVPWADLMESDED